MAVDEERFAKLEKNVETLISRLEDSGGDDKTPDLDKLSDSELEQMPRRDFARLLASTVSKSVGSVKKEVDERLDETRGEVSRAQIRSELQEVASRHPEIQYLREPLKAMMEEHPDLSIQRMVNLIRAEQPEVYQEALGKHEEVQKGSKEDDTDTPGKGDDKTGKGGQDSKAAGEKGSGSKDDADAGDKGAKGTGGIPPTGAGGGTGDDTGGADQKLSVKEAGQSAWDELFGDKDTLSSGA